MSAEKARADKLQRMLQRLGARTNDYLSALANGERPDDTEHGYLAQMAYDYAFHTEAMVAAEPDEQAVEF